MDDAAKDIVAADRATMVGLSAPLGHREVEASMGTGLVVVTHVFAKHRLELTA